MHKNLLGLPDPVGAIGGLILDRRVPPRIVMNNRVRGSQIQPDTASFQADQEQRHVAGLEFPHRRRAVLGIARQFDEFDLVFLQSGLDQRQHFGELGEQQDPPPLGEHDAEHFHQPIQLRRSGLGFCHGLQLQQPRIAARLAHFQQRVQNDDAGAGQAPSRQSPPAPWRASTAGSPRRSRAAWFPSPPARRFRSSAAVR